MTAPGYFRTSLLLPLAGISILSIAAVPRPAAAEETVPTTPEVSVSATRIATPLRQIGSAVTVITAEELEEQGTTYVADALRRVPGVAVTQSGSFGGTAAVRLRGEEGFRTLVLLDGIDIADPASTQAQAEFANLLVTEIERIEVLRGPQSLLYGGDAIGGVISITSKRGTADEFHGTVQGVYGSFDTWDGAAAARGGYGPVDGSISIRGLTSDGFSAREGNGFSEDDGYDNETIHGVVGFQPLENLRFEGIFRHVDADSEFDRFADTPRSELFTEQNAGRVTADLGLLEGRWTNKLGVSYIENKRNDYENGAPNRDFFGNLATQFDGERIEADYVGSFAVSDSHLILFGGDFEREEVVTSSLKADAEIAGGFVEYQGAFFDSLFVTAGARFDDHSEFGFNDSYRGTVAYLHDFFGAESFLGETKFKGAVGTGFRTPSLFELFDQSDFGSGPIGNPNLDAEQSFGWEAGVEQIFWDNRGSVELVYFDQQIEDEIRFDNTFFSGYFQSDGTSRSHGVEASLRLTPLRNLDIFAAYTWNHASVDSPDADSGLDRVRRPRHTGDVTVNYRFLKDRANINVNVHAVAGHEDGFLTFRTELDDYITVNLAGSFRVHENVEFFGRIVNLFDEDYQEVDGFGTQRLSGYGGVRVSW